jgi:hypothetical protein
VDNDYSVDLEDVANAILTNDVVVLRFVSVPKRLLLDFRATGVDGPTVRCVHGVRSIEERYEHLRRIRPRFPAPERVVAVFWPRFIASLVSTGVWDHVMRRLTDSGYVDSVREAHEAFAELEALERQHHRAAITGDGFRTLWSAERAHR